MASARNIEIISAGRTFLRPGGREGRWRNQLPDPDPDDHVACPFDFVIVPGTEAASTLDTLKSRYRDMTPILFGSPHEAGMHFERMAYRPERAADWLAAAAHFDVDDWLAGRQRELDTWSEKSATAVPRRGPWPETVKSFDHLLVSIDVLTDEPKPTVIIGLLPTTDPTETAAYLSFGGWNDCPKPPVHIALARRWRDRYGAVQVSNTYESVEFTVARPLTDREEAMTLAMLQLHYCSDIFKEYGHRPKIASARQPQSTYKTRAVDPGYATSAVAVDAFRENEMGWRLQWSLRCHVSTGSIGPTAYYLMDDVIGKPTPRQGA